jgi:hypothetical protein
MHYSQSIIIAMSKVLRQVEALAEQHAELKLKLHAADELAQQTGHLKAQVCPHPDSKHT